MRDGPGPVKVEIVICDGCRFLGPGVCLHARFSESSEEAVRLGEFNGMYVTPIWCPVSRGETGPQKGTVGFVQGDKSCP